MKINNIEEYLKKSLIGTEIEFYTKNELNFRSEIRGFMEVKKGEEDIVISVSDKVIDIEYCPPYIEYDEIIDPSCFFLTTENKFSVKINID